MIPRYRAWGRDGNYPGTPSEKFEMFYDVSVVTTHQDKVQHVIADFGMYNESEYNGTEIIDYTLMQSTGLFDKNGKEIFEGDILKFNDSWNDYCYEGYVDGEIEGINFVEIESETACFVFGKTKISDSSLFYYTNEEHLTFQEIITDTSFEFEIIGNIYENPELAEVDS